jgi:hypothetical protein
MESADTPDWAPSGLIVPLVAGWLVVAEELTRPSSGNATAKQYEGKR